MIEGRLEHSFSDDDVFGQRDEQRPGDVKSAKKPIIGVVRYRESVWDEKEGAG